MDLAAPSSEISKPKASHLFYQAHGSRPRIARTEGIYAWDVSGKRYIDASSGPMVSNIGHSNPRVLAAMKEQMDRATFAYRLHFENDAAEELASLTASLMPAGLDRIFFTSGGSETVETCLKLARQYTIANGEPERYKVISMTPSYHGATLGCVAVTGMELFVEPFRAMIREMPKISAPTCYLDRDSLSMEERGLRYAEQLRDRILAEGPETVLAFIMEPVGGASTGALVAPDSWYARIQEICREFGVLLIADEVMTGAGRTGRFLGIEHWQLDADIIGMAKGFAAGYAPLGAVAARRSIVDAVMASGGFAHGYTYAGNPLACAAGNAVLKEVLANGLIENAETRGRYLKSRLGELMDRFPFVGDVRGKGLLLAFEFVADRDSMEPLPVELNAYSELVEEAYGRGLIIYARRTRGGFRGDHFMVCPPLIVTDEEIDEIMELLVASIEAYADARGLPR
ncbi:MAG: aspartate aminotransferase family protein [Woeseiaceae bacterium]